MVVQSLGLKDISRSAKLQKLRSNFAKWDIDEIIIQDIDAAREERIIDLHLLQDITKHCYVPVTVAGGINTLDHVQQVIRNGADKVCLNSVTL